MVQIEDWFPEHPRWAAYERFLEAADLRPVFDGIVNGGVLLESHFLAALKDDQLVGILIFLTQPIGPETDVPVIHDPDGRPLIEAKVRAFHVLPDHRNQGIGTVLQRELLRLASTLGCYQVRSRSELTKEANYAIKMKLGFAMHPAIRTFPDGRTSPGVYWVRTVDQTGREWGE